MLKLFYMVISSVEILIFMSMIARYIFFEKGFRTRRSWLLYFCAYLITATIVFLANNNGDLSAFVPFLYFMIFIFASREKRKISGVFLVIPVSGVMLSILILPVSVIYLISGSMKVVMETNSAWTISLDLIFWLCLGAFFLKSKKWREDFDDILQSRTLSGWEKKLLNAVGLFFLAFSVLVLCIDEIQIDSLYAKIFVLVGIVCVIFIEISMIAMIMQGNRKQHFQNAAVLNQYYLKAQLEHFRTYQETQKEVRRIHHDMKNQTSCLFSLISEKRFEEAENYIIELNDRVHYIDKELHSGNYITDAILNEKNAVARRENIQINVDGILGGLKMEPVDICTIFSNALDNCIESLSGSVLDHKQIQIELKTKNSMHFFRFINPVEDEKYTLYNRSILTTKKDNINHGFGIGNIKMAVEKYNGTMNYGIESADGAHYYVMEIIVFE